MGTECLVVQAVTILQPTWLSSLVASYTGDEHANNLMPQLAIDSNAQEGYNLKKGILYQRKAVYG